MPHIPMKKALGTGVTPRDEIIGIAREKQDAVAKDPGGGLPARWVSRHSSGRTFEKRCNRTWTGLHCTEAAAYSEQLLLVKHASSGEFPETARTGYSFFRSVWLHSVSGQSL